MASVKDLTPYGIHLESCRHISQNDYENLVRQGCRPEVGDVLIAKDGATALDTVCEIKLPVDTVLLSSIAILRPNPDIVHSTFLRYWLDSATNRTYMKNAFTTGAAIPRVVLKDFKRVELQIPPLPTQRKIAAILSAYDDLIENNTRRIKILEEMAQTIYREWFVNFRFPEHEKVKMVESELGMIPEGWEVKKIGDVVAYLNRGVPPKYDDKSHSLVINQKCIRSGTVDIKHARRHTTRVAKEKMVQFGDVLINSTGVGTLGRVAQFYDHIIDCTIDTHVTLARPSDCVSIDYFGFCLLDMQNIFDHMGAGTTNQTELSRTNIACSPIIIPRKGLQDRFGTLVSPLRTLSTLLRKHNENLRHTRDMLLPKLISGEVDVTELDINVKEFEI